MWETPDDAEFDRLVEQWLDGDPGARDAIHALLDRRAAELEEELKTLTGRPAGL